MSDLKLFRIAEGEATEVTSSSVALERSLQKLIEANMETLFGVRLLASEFSTGVRHGGRMDSLGIDENGSPITIVQGPRFMVQGHSSSWVLKSLVLSSGPWTTDLSGP